MNCWNEQKQRKRHAAVVFLFRTGSNVRVACVALVLSPRSLCLQCPLYRTNVRAGVLSTTGASTNYVLDVSFPTPEEHGPSFFVLQGTAGLTMLND